MFLRTEREGDLVTIRIQGEFSFKLRREFREAYRNQPPGTRYRVDLAGVKYMDSSAIGMLLVLKEEAGGEGADVVLANMGPEVRTILELSRMNELFRFE